MTTEHEIRQLYDNVKQLNELTLKIYNRSDNFPAVNRNCKRIMASVKMLMLNLEQADTV